MKTSVFGQVRKPTSLPIFGVGNRVKMGPYSLHIYKIEWVGHYSYVGVLYKDNVVYNRACSLSEMALMRNGVVE